MSNNEDFLAAKQQFMLIPEDKILTAHMPVDIFNQEADNLEHWCRDDRDALLLNGLSEELLNSLPLRVNASREAQGRWTKERRLKNDNQHLWKKKAPISYAMRDGLIRSFRFAFRNHPELLATVNDIAEGDGHADMIQDLVSLSLLGKDHIPLLEAINFNLDLLNQSDTMATDMGDLLAEINGDRMKTNETKIIRDRAFTYLKEAVDEIRDHGKYIFWNNEERLQGYYSNYSRKKSERYRAAKKEEQAEF
jgi:hypothetical protein